MKKKKLEAYIDYDFTVIGLICPLKEYKLAWYLNQALDIQLIKEKDIDIAFLKKQNLLISNFLYDTEHSYFRLLKNKSVSEYEDNPAFLIPELNKFDFILLANGYEDTYSLDELKAMIGKVPKIQYVQAFPVEGLKSKENLIF